MAVVIKFILHCHHNDMNRACVRFPKRWCCCRANGWFTLRTKFTFKGTSPTIHLCMVRQTSEFLTTFCCYEETS